MTTHLDWRQKSNSDVHRTCLHGKYRSCRGDNEVCNGRSTVLNVILPHPRVREPVHSNLAAPTDLRLDDNMSVS